MGEVQSFVPSRRTILTTVQVEVEAGDGSYHLCRVLLDTGSDHNYITTSMAKRLLLKRRDTCIPMTGVNEKVTIVKELAESKISSRYGKYELET